MVPRTAAATARWPESAPVYRRRDGELIAPPPYQVSCNDLFLFVLEADAGKLQAVCDHALNLGPTRYTPFGRFAILYAANIDDFSMGTSCTTREIGIWIPVVASDPGGTTLRVYSPYVWIDSETSTILGRSVYGYTKQTADVRVPGVATRSRFT